MTEKIYVVFQEWQDKYGDRDSQILGVTNNKEEAIQILQDERAEILANSPYTADELANHDAYDLTDTAEYFSLFDKFGGWDEITIIEKETKIRDFIIINIYCQENAKVTKRVYLDEIIKADKRKCGCFYEFEQDGKRYQLCSDEHKDGSINTDNMWCFIYKKDKMNSVRTWCVFDSRVNN